MTSHFCFSVVRYIAENGGSAAVPEAGAAVETTSPSSEDQAEEEDKPHDNYVNFDIAQTVLEANARKESQAAARGESGQNETSDVDYCCSFTLCHFSSFQLKVFLPCR